MLQWISNQENKGRKKSHQPPQCGRYPQITSWPWQSRGHLTLPYRCCRLQAIGRSQKATRATNLRQLEQAEVEIKRQVRDSRCRQILKHSRYETQEQRMRKPFGTEACDLIWVLLTSLGTLLKTKKRIAHFDVASSIYTSRLESLLAIQVPKKPRKRTYLLCDLWQQRGVPLQLGRQIVLSIMCLPAGEKKEIYPVVPLTSVYSWRD